MVVTHGESLSPAELTRVRRMIEQATDHDGVPPLDEAATLRLRGSWPGVEHLLCEDGYAQLLHGEGRTQIDLLVRPAARRRGIGRALLESADGQHPLAGWAHGDLPAARGFARAVGARMTRLLLRMATGLDAEVRVPPSPDGVRLRGYRDGDREAVLGVNAAAFAGHPEQGGWSLRDLDERIGSDWFDPDGLLLAVAEEDGELLGFHWTKRLPGSDQAEVYVVAVAPAGRGRGLGRLLTCAGMRYQQDRGATRMDLYVDDANRPAKVLYQDLGFRVVERHARYTLTSRD